MTPEAKIPIILTSISLFFTLILLTSLLYNLCIKHRKASQDLEKARQETENRLLTEASLRVTPGSDSSDAFLRVPAVQNPAPRQCQCTCQSAFVNPRYAELEAPLQRPLPAVMRGYGVPSGGRTVLVRDDRYARGPIGMAF